MRRREGARRVVHLCAFVFCKDGQPRTHVAPGFLLIFAGSHCNIRPGWASAESIDPKRDRLGESHLSKNPCPIVERFIRD